MVQTTINSLAELERHIVVVDERYKGNISGSAWKCIHVKRDNQDIGSLFDIREEAYANTK